MRLTIRECAVVYRRRAVECELAGSVIRSSDDVAKLARALGAHELATESMWVLLLDARQKLAGVHECARGGVSAVAVALSDMLRAAIVTGAPALILVHNHPSGSTAPSAEDYAFTDRAAEACKLLSLSLLDHVIVAEGGHFSMLDMGDLRESTLKRRAQSA